MPRPKHRNDYNHGKNGYIGGNPRYGKAKAERHQNDQSGNHAPRRKPVDTDPIAKLLGKPNKNGTWTFGLKKQMRYYTCFVDALYKLANGVQS